MKLMSWLQPAFKHVLSHLLPIMLEVWRLADVMLAERTGLVVFQPLVDTFYVEAVKAR